MIAAHASRNGCASSIARIRCNHFVPGMGGNFGLDVLALNLGLGTLGPGRDGPRRTHLTEEPQCGTLIDDQR